MDVARQAHALSVQHAGTPQNSPTKDSSSTQAWSYMRAWPSTSAAHFANLPQHTGSKMIRTPEAYHATYDTMPPVEQVIRMEPTQFLLRAAYQSSDRKMTGKRESADSRDAMSESALANHRPQKAPRPS